MRRTQITVACMGLVQVLCPLRGMAQVCPIDAPGNCQGPGSTSSLSSRCIGHLSDRRVSTRAADDFRPTGNLLQHVCFSPCFRGGSGSSTFLCDETAPGRGTQPPDMFVLKVYEEDHGKPGLLAPGVPVEGIPLIVESKAPHAPCGGSSSSQCWQYYASVNPPAGLTLTPDDCYWLEITGLGEVQAQGPCYISLKLSSTVANDYMVYDIDGLYADSDLRADDLPFCIDSGLHVATAPPSSLDGGCGKRPVTCCTKHIGCADNYPYYDCVTRNGVVFDNATCADPEVADFCAAPPNDLCADAIDLTDCILANPVPDPGWCSIPYWIPGTPYEICDPMAQDCLDPTAECTPFESGRESYRCVFDVNNVQAMTDGSNTQSTSCMASGVNQFQADIWYNFVAPCSGRVVVDGCPSDVAFDSMLMLYSDHTPTCRPCPISNNQFHLVCADDNCRVSGGASAAGAAITQNACYTIRFGSWSQLGTPWDTGQGEGTQTLSIVCGDPPPPPPSPGTPTVPATPHNYTKNRYISFTPMNLSTASAFRVIKTSTPSGTCWVGAPDALGNSKCMPAPVFRNWNEPVIHLGDCFIVPKASYSIRSTLDAVSFSDPLTVSTTFSGGLNPKHWGDVAGSNNGIVWNPPDFYSNIYDILAILAFITNDPIKPTFQQANLQAISSADPCLNTVINTADVLAVVSAAAGDLYPFTTNPANCPVCP